MVCSKCGNTVGENERFCSKCGALVSQQAANGQQSSNTPTKEEETFCGAASVKQKTPASPTVGATKTKPPQARPPAKRAHVPILIAASVVVALCIALGVVLGLNAQTGGKPAASTPPSTAPLSASIASSSVQAPEEAASAPADSSSLADDITNAIGARFDSIEMFQEQNDEFWYMETVGVDGYGNGVTVYDFNDGMSVWVNPSTNIIESLVYMPRRKDWRWPPLGLTRNATEEQVVEASREYGLGEPVPHEEGGQIVYEFPIRLPHLPAEDLVTVEVRFTDGALSTVWLTGPPSGNAGGGASAQIPPGVTEWDDPVRGDVYATGGLHLRTGPGTQYESLGLIPEGAMVTVLGTAEEAPDWRYVEFEGVAGFAHSDYIVLAYVLPTKN